MTSKRIAIVGGGISGLALAVALAQAQNVTSQNASSTTPAFRIDIYESAREFGEIGLGMGMWPRPIAILERLGLSQEVEGVIFRAAGEVSMEFRKSDQPEGNLIHTFPTSVAAMNSFHRQDLQRLLLSRALENPNTRTHTAHRLVKLTQGDPLSLFFENGAIATADIVIGADGIRSNVRSQIFSPSYTQHQSPSSPLIPSNTAGKTAGVVAGAAPPKSDSEPPAPEYLGDCIYRGLIPVNTLPAEHLVRTDRFIIYGGKGKHVISYPISGGTHLNVGFFTRERDPAGPPVDLRTEFSGWEGVIGELLDHMPPNPLRSPLYALPHLSSFVSPDGKVALIGDAAHAMPPHLGAGASQALEDSYTLAPLIVSALTSGSDTEGALRAYDAARRPFVQALSDDTRLTKSLYQLCAPEIQIDGDKISAGAEAFFKESVGRLFAWSYASLE
ncbi:FAD/NAD(P)-binding domain-containing protein [Cylindrobasidium torrendii FP15055 ss-10]|uniref:FAD/NAD(P)-binding domain-containing protein n=1 Tax=Cylindrobasidium torrendii FP15055 ss-10 TaxID=1314674 RepID=A0A0D7BEY3_9AGAR|nr:FAD/NAD(P)-binding domain-containing protein [Cylindrobasidium torrendii FP15055 ss-10]